MAELQNLYLDASITNAAGYITRIRVKTAALLIVTFISPFGYLFFQHLLPAQHVRHHILLISNTNKGYRPIYVTSIYRRPA